MNVKTIENPDARGERGQTLLLVALSIIGVVAAVGLATDGAVVFVAQRHLQRALDAAALAAANKLPDQEEAEDAAYQFMRLHGYDFDSDGLDIEFPETTPARKIATVAATVNQNLFFLNVVGWHNVDVIAEGEGESAPLDVYLALDLSNSMVYDTPRPSWWNDNATRFHVCPQTGCHWSLCDENDDTSWNACRAYYCNYEGDLTAGGGGIVETKERNCDPLDEHIKPAAKFFVDQLDSDYDRIGLIGYDRQGHVEQRLTDDFDALKSAIDNMDAYPVTSYEDNDAYLCTNIGDGLLSSNYWMSQPAPPSGDGGRIDSVWSTVLLTDGRANMFRDCPGCPDICTGCPVQECSWTSGVCPQANEWARLNANSAWTQHKIFVYTIAYGRLMTDPTHPRYRPEYKQLMIDIADIADNGELDGDTENFWEAPDEAGLRESLAEIAERMYTRLLR
jgi:Flp pilus assembly protein TadG